ncbi:acyl-CoA dehydrogenase family protein [Parahaliea mediterranea]|uniref:acyl-CoA dehydrogenase family protein n=1 Tax=Parahaliea mediterranea TaxID=651086 RepID=UPI000E2F0334|nr:acyl-CoA dehydrogenase family protein [Parahaliea mediterranea]
MEQRNFTEEHQMFREAFRLFLEREVVPHQAAWREQGMVSRDLWLKAGEQGYLLPWADEAYGGLGVSDFRYTQIQIEELMRIGETGFYLPLHSALVAPYIGNNGSEEQKQRLLPPCIRGESILAVAMTEPGAGSDLAGMKATAERRGDDWVLNGAKTFISNGQLADIVVVAAKTNPQKPREIGLFLVERGMAGFARGRHLKKLGMHSQDTSELFFDNVVVPAANVLGDPAKGFHYLMAGLAEERLIAAATNVASCQAAFDWTMDYIQERQLFGRRLGAMQNTRFKMAEMRTEIDIAQVYVDHCVTLLNDGRLTGDAAAKIKLFSSELQARVVDECLQFFGGYGYMDEYPISRAYADARITRIFGGTSEVMKEIIARSIGLTEQAG